MGAPRPPARATRGRRRRDGLSPNLSRPRIIVVGAGPGGLAAVGHLRERGAGRVEVTLVTRAGEASHLAGTLAVALGERPATDFVTAVSVPGVDCRAGDVEALDSRGVVIGGARLEADAVIAAPGLELDAGAVPAWSRARVAWDVPAAAAAADALAGLPGGRLAIVICGLPFRCPPAPFSLAMAIAQGYRGSGRFTKVCVTTPEPLPLAAVGGDAPGFLMEACAGAEIEVERRFEPDLGASEDGLLRAVDGRELDYELALFIPPHRRSRALAALGGEGPLVPVGVRGETSDAGLYVVGDAAATGLPCAAGVARAQGITAADAVLAELGLAEPREPQLPEPACYLLHGRGTISRIRLRYPNGLPPDGEPEVTIDGPTPDLAHAIEGERERFLAAARGG